MNIEHSLTLEQLKTDLKVGQLILGDPSWGFAERVLRYYHAIDRFRPEMGQDNMSEVLAIFDPRIIYNRHNILVSGIDALENFIRHDRTLRGRHTLPLVQESFGSVYVEGHFSGTRLDPHGIRTPTEEDFVDHFLFVSKELVVIRASFFPSGLKI